MTESSGITRGQNVVYVLPHDWSSVAHFAAPVLDRLDPDSSDVQSVVVSSDPETAAAVAAAVARLADARGLRVIPATNVRRATRLLPLQRPQVVVGAARELLGLVQASALKLDAVRSVVIAWANEILNAGAAGEAEALFADVPKGAARSVVTSELTPEVEAMIERYAWRARRIAPDVPDSPVPINVRYVTCSPGARVATLRRLLDHLDPSSATIFVRSDDAERMVRDALAGIGFSGDDAIVRVSRTATGERGDLVVLFELPATHQELRELAGPTPAAVVAVVQPRQLTTLRALAATGSISAIALPGAGDRARARDDAVRQEIRSELEAGSHGRELLALEPLLDDYDGIEIAAAALRLLERARVERAAALATNAEAPSALGMTKLFVNVGAKDNARSADLVGAIANEGGITKAQIGRVDLRETFSLVEVDARVAADVAAKLTGITIRGRRVQARLEQDRPPRRSYDAAGPANRGRPGRPRDGGRGRAGPERRGSGPPRDESGRAGYHRDRRDG